MPTIGRSALAAVAALIWAGSAAAQQTKSTNTGTAATAQPPSSPSPKTGACVMTSSNRTTSCTAQIDEGACRALGPEMHAQTVWNPGQGCP